MQLDITHDGDRRVRRHWSILEKSLGVLRQGFDPARPTRIACLQEVGAEVEVEWLAPESAARRLRRLAERVGGLSGFEELARRLAAPGAAAQRSPDEEPAFDCLVMADGLLTHFEVSAPDPRQDAFDRVANLVATLRGLRAATFDIASAPPGLGYAVRAEGCAACGAWKQALQRAGVWADAMQAPEPIPMALADPALCTTCFDELEAAVDAARATLQLEASAVREASEPAYVLQYLGIAG